MNRELRDASIAEPQATAAEQLPTQLHPMLIQLSEEQQAELVAIIKEDFRNASEAREKRSWGLNKEKTGLTFDEKYAELYRLYEGDDSQRPEAWMSSRSLKIAQAIVEMAVARLLPMVFNEDALRWRAVRSTNKNYVMLVNRMMYWILLIQMRVRHDALMVLRETVMSGTAFVEAYWKRVRKDMGQKELIGLVDEVGQQMLDEHGQPMTVEQKVLAVEERAALRIIPLTRVYTQPGASDLEEDPYIILESWSFSELEGWQNDGMAQNITDKLKTEVDSRIAKESGLSLEKAENIADFGAKRRNAKIECLRWVGKYDFDKDGFAEDITAIITREDSVFVRAFRIKDISLTGDRPLRKINYIDRIGDRLLGMGLLEQVKPLAEEIDACFRQMTDANTLSVMRWGFFDPDGDYDPQEHVAKPRAMYPVSNPSQNVYFPDIQIPIERLINAIRLVLEFIERLTAASAYVMGKESEVVGGSGTATRTQAIVSAADTRFSLPAMGIREGLAQVFTDVFNLYVMNKPEGLAEKVLGKDGDQLFPDDAAMQAALATEMECYLVPAADLGDVNTKRQLASLLYDKLVGGGNPLVVADPSRIWFATANMLVAYGEEPVDWIGRPATTKPTNDPAEEAAMFRDGRFCPVEPQENHLEHISVHMDTLRNPETQHFWPLPAVQKLQEHIAQHQEMLQRVLQTQAQMPQTSVGGESPNGAESGRPSAITGGVALNGGEPSVAGNPQQSAGTIQQQAAGAAGGGELL